MGLAGIQNYLNWPPGIRRAWGRSEIPHMRDRGDDFSDHAPNVVTIVGLLIFPNNVIDTGINIPYIF